MKKIIFTLALIIALACVFTACNKTPDNSSNPNENQSNTNTTCEHVWETVTTNPTCATEGYDTMTCTLCDEVVKTNVVEKLEHNYDTAYTIDNDYHWYKCTACNAVSGKESHTLDDEGVCTVCDLPITPTPGVIYELSVDNLYAIVTGYTGTAAKVKIAEEYNGVPVNSIYDNAFLYCKRLRSVVIPDSVTSIGGDAFRGCSRLASVVIPDSVISIGSSAFLGCSRLTSIVISDSVTSIGNDTFYECSSLTSVVIPSSVTSIGESAFYVCSSLTSVVIPDSVTSIGRCAFAGCFNLTSIVIPDGVTSIGEGAFAACSSLSQIIVNTGNNNYASIDGNLYSKDAKVLIQYVAGKNDSEFYIPDSVTSIGDWAFSGCSSLTSIVIPDSVTSIGNYAFFGCSSLESVAIPDGVTSIGIYAFYGCSSLEYVVIPDGVTSIGDSAFFNCNDLIDVYYIGSEEEWAEITIDFNNSCLTDATIHYNYVPEE